MKIIMCMYQNYQFITYTTCLIIFKGTTYVYIIYIRLKFIQVSDIVKQNKHTNRKQSMRFKLHRSLEFM